MVNGIQKIYAEGCTQILKTTDCCFFGQVEQKGSSYLRHAESKKDNLSIPCAYRCLEHLPSFTFHAKPPLKPPDTLNRNSMHIDARASAVPLGRGVFHKEWAEPMLLTVRVSLLWRAWSLNFRWVRRMPLLHLVLKNLQLLFWNTLTQIMRKIKMWLSLTWPTSFTLLWVRNVFLLVGKKSRSLPFTTKALSLIPTITAFR